MTGGGPPAPLRWRVLVHGAADGPRNMAIDHALVRGLAADQGIVRFYAWEPATISLGRHQPARGQYDVSAAAAAGLDFVRRPTGGRAVLHADELTYAVVVPLRRLGGARATYRRVHQGLVAGLRAFGVEATLVSEGIVERPSMRACFATPAPGEIEWGGRKLVGSAQVRVGSNLLQHGSLLVGDDQRRLRLFSRSPGPLEPPGATLTEALGQAPRLDDLIAHLGQGLRSALCSDDAPEEGEDEGGDLWESDQLSAEERGAADALEAQYRDPEWTWRR